MCLERPWRRVSLGVCGWWISWFPPWAITGRYLKSSRPLSLLISPSVFVLSWHQAVIVGRLTSSTVCARSWRQRWQTTPTSSAVWWWGLRMLDSWETCQYPSNSTIHCSHQCYHTVFTPTTLGIFVLKVAYILFSSNICMFFTATVMYVLHRKSKEKNS